MWCLVAPKNKVQAPLCGANFYPGFFKLTFWVISYKITWLV